MRTSVLLGYKEDKCLAQGQRERESCPRTMRSSVLLNDNVILLWYKEGKCLAQGQAGRLFRRGQVLGKSVLRHQCMIA